MKKILLLLFSLCLFLTASPASANPFLNDDPNYVWVDVNQGKCWYIDRSSLYVEKYEPPQYIIVTNVCTVPRASYGETTITNVFPMRFFYNWKENKMYVDKKFGTSDWMYLQPLGPAYINRLNMPAGEMAFYLAYHKKFYGRYKYSSATYRYPISLFTDEFYDGVL